MATPAHRAASAARLPRPGDLGRFALAVLRGLAGLWLTVALALAACVGLARLAGWPAAVVISGSMRPAVQVGDIVLADPGGAGRVGRGQIVLVRRPGFPGQLLTHRVARVLPDGAVVTRGDANPSDDATPVPRQDVLGVVRVVVPALGRPTMLAHRRSVGDLAFTALLVGSALLVATGPGSRSLRPGAATRRPDHDGMSAAGAPMADSARR